MESKFKSQFEIDQLIRKQKREYVQTNRKRPSLILIHPYDWELLGAPLLDIKKYFYGVNSIDGMLYLSIPILRSMDVKPGTIKLI